MSTGSPERLKADEQFDEEAKALALSLSDEPYWNLPIALLWIAYRDLQEAAGLMLRWQKIDPDLQSGGFIEFLMVDLEGKGGRAFSIRPDRDLSAALRRGQVHALGCRNGKLAAAPIVAETWNNLHLVDQPSSMGHFSACIDPSVSDAEFWRDIGMDRCSLLACFPPAGSRLSREQTELRAVGNHPVWFPKPSEGIKEWVARNAVVEEKDRRRRENPLLESDQAALHEMAVAAGKKWKKDSIRNQLPR